MTHLASAWQWKTGHFSPVLFFHLLQRLFTTPIPPHPS
jgi:hypothetical protein